MPSKTEQKAQSPGLYFAAVSVLSDWTYPPVSFMGVAGDVGFVRARGHDGSAKWICCIFAAFAPNDFLWWLWPPSRGPKSPYSHSFLSPCSPHTSHLRKTPVVAAGRIVGSPSSPLSWTWRGTDCKTRCVQKTKSQELSCLSIPFVVLMRHGSAVLCCEGPAGCKLIFYQGDVHQEVCCCFVGR